MKTEGADIVVVGGGVAGYAAAMSASENNSVILVEGSSHPGGATTQTNVGTLCGLYYRSPSATLVHHSFCKKFVDDLFQYDEQARLVSMPDELHVISYEWSNLQKLLVEKLNSGKVKLLLNTKITQAAFNDNIVTSMLTERGTRINGEAFIDCTGTGNVAQLVGHSMIRDESYQSASQVIRLSNVKTQNEYSLNLAMKKAVVMRTSANSFPRSYSSISVIPGSLTANKVDLKLPLSTVITDRVDQSATLKKEVEQNITALLATIREVESLSEAIVDIIFPSPGIRIQQRPKGSSILTEDHVVNCKNSSDAVAIGTWPIEEWDYDGKVKVEHLQGDSYTIPSGCLMSPSFKNLFFAGKGISAETRAIASARVTGTCLQTGYAAGKLATSRNDMDMKKIISEIQREISSRQ